jgi:hypothetical protein
MNRLFAQSCWAVLGLVSAATLANAAAPLRTDILNTVVVPQSCGAPAPPPPITERFLAANAVVLGKVTAIEKDTVEVSLDKDGKQKMTFNVAVVKVEANFAGADKLTHIKIGYVVPKVDPKLPPHFAGRGAPYGIPPAPGSAEAVFFLQKHEKGGFSVISPLYGLISSDTPYGKTEIAQIKQLSEALADPTKSLKSDKAELRSTAAIGLITKYSIQRFSAPGSTDANLVPIDADESRLILKGLAEGDWALRPHGLTEAFRAFQLLNLNEKDGWKSPAFPQPKPGQPPADFGLITQEAFVKWLDGAGKDYVLRKYVSKK